MWICGTGEEGLPPRPTAKAAKGDDDDNDKKVGGGGDESPLKPPSAHRRGRHVYWCCRRCLLANRADDRVCELCEWKLADDTVLTGCGFPWSEKTVRKEGALRAEQGRAYRKVHERQREGEQQRERERVAKSSLDSLGLSSSSPDRKKAKVGGDDAGDEKVGECFMCNAVFAITELEFHVNESLENGGKCRVQSFDHMFLSDDDDDSDDDDEDKKKKKKKKKKRKQSEDSGDSDWKPSSQEGKPASKRLKKGGKETTMDSQSTVEQ